MTWEQWFWLAWPIVAAGLIIGLLRLHDWLYPPEWKKRR
jgi:hypothetical protein